MSRRRPLTPQQLAEIAEAAGRGPDGKPLRDMMREMIEGRTAPEHAVHPSPKDPPAKG